MNINGDDGALFSLLLFFLVPARVFSFRLDRIIVRARRVTHWFCTVTIRTATAAATVIIVVHHYTLPFNVSASSE